MRKFSCCFKPKDSSVIWWTLSRPDWQKSFRALGDLQEYVLDRPYYRAHDYTINLHVGAVENGEMTFHICAESSKIPEWVWEWEFEYGRHKGKRW